MPGLTAALPLDEKGHMVLWYAALGDGGLESRMESDLRAEMADVWLAAAAAGDEKCIELGRDGEARGMMSLGSELPDA